jgi:hypothetical protein
MVMDVVPCTGSSPAASHPPLPRPLPSRPRCPAPSEALLVSSVGRSVEGEEGKDGAGTSVVVSGRSLVQARPRG